MVDEITFEILRHRLDSINEDAASVLANQSGSQLAAEARDLNSVIMTAEGAVVCCGRYVLSQVVSMNLVVQDILGKYADNPGIGPGDQFITNDPYVATLHQPDVVVVAPIFVQGELIGWCGSTTHQPDVGGPNPGGITYDARSIFDEAPAMPPIRLVEGGRLRSDLAREYLSRSRTADLNRLDMLGQIAANNSVIDQMGIMCREYGSEIVIAVFAQILDRAESMFRRRLQELPDARFRHVSYVEYRPHGAAKELPEEVFAIRLTMTKRADHLMLDFSESDPQAPGAINSAYPALVNFALGSVMIYLCGGLLWAPGGIWRAVEIVSRRGTVVDAEWPAGVAMSTAASSQAIRICVNACAARLLDSSSQHERLVMASCQAAGGGGGTIHGTTSAGRPFATMTLDEISGGGGATWAADGADSSGITTSPGASCINVEVNESYLPLRYHERSELLDTGGPGIRRGGVGSLASWSPDGTKEPISVMSFGQGLQHPLATGVAGGEFGARSVIAILGRPDQLVAGELPMPSNSMLVDAEQVYVGASQGGGGVGDPLDRVPVSVADDVLNGYVSVEGAARDYGVVVNADGEIDSVATNELRLNQRRERIGREPAPQVTQPPRARRVSSSLTITESGRVECARCAMDLADESDPIHDVLVKRASPVDEAAPLGVRFPGAQRFELRRFWCPSCAAQIDVQLSLASEPVVRTMELLAPETSL